MLFNSYDFILAFLPVTLLVAYQLRRQGRRAVEAWLLIASLVFYAWWDVRFLPLLLGSVAGNYLMADIIERTRSRLLLAVAIGANLLLIAIFKYLGFFAGIARDLTLWEVSLGTIVLPLAISFFTFQQISYQVDRWRGETVRHDILDYAFFVTFFPQLIAGPIVRQSEFLPQLQRFAQQFNAQNLFVGMTFFAIGLFKKVVLADSFALHASPVFDGALAGAPIDAWAAWLGALSYAFQIYFDFSGYSDMAIGLGRMFGLRLPINFNAPYRAASISEFWRRWHITLSRFLKDYLYIPLGGNRKGAPRQLLNLFIVMFLGGLWHGAAWTFIVWGVLHGAGLACHRLWRSRVALPEFGLAGRCAGWAATFLFVVVAWVFFRAESFQAAFTILQAMGGMSPTQFQPKPVISDSGAKDIFAQYGGWMLIAIGLAWVLLLPASHQFMRRYMRARMYDHYLRAQTMLAWRLRPAWLAGSAAVLAVAFMSLSRVSEFIYYQF